MNRHFDGLNRISAFLKLHKRNLLEMNNGTEKFLNSRLELSNENLNISICHSEKPFSKFVVSQLRVISYGLQKLFYN